jgi:SAM-dependent methyltransferase
MKTLNDIEAKTQLDELISQYGKFEAHNIQLSDNVFTMEAGSTRGFGRHGRFIALATSLYGPDLTGLKVLDLACMEGMTAIAFAKRGATALGVEVRDHHLNKARGVAKILGLTNASFVTDDVRNVTKEKYGSFDIVICSGILYHLDAPDVFKFVNNIADCCSRLLVIDTSIAAVGRKKVKFEGVAYAGRYAIEHSAKDDEKTKRERTWASIDNVRSFYLTRASLINLMTNSGISCVSELKMPFKYKDGFPRTTFFGFKAKSDVSLAGNHPFAETPYKPPIKPNKRLAPNAVQDIRKSQTSRIAQASKRRAAAKA